MGEEARSGLGTGLAQATSVDRRPDRPSCCPGSALLTLTRSGLSRRRVRVRGTWGEVCVVGLPQRQLHAEDPGEAGVWLWELRDAGSRGRGSEGLLGGEGRMAGPEPTRGAQTLSKGRGHP